jgi:UDP-2,4-diacetamido-2,4,6-trideoxy-beta-L-altropyranose hydrolase
MGHVYRCMALAAALRSHLGEARFQFIAPSPGASRALREAGLEEVHEGRPLEPADALIFDRLSITEEEILRLRHLGRLVISLDDTGPGHFQADLAINGLYSCKAAKPENGVETLSLAGLEFIAIDPRFAAPYDFRDQARRLFITQGGADTYGLVPELIRLADGALPNDAEFHIHVGPAFSHETELKDALKTLQRPFELHRHVKHMPELMRGMDLALAAGGIMAIELAACGVPLLLVTGENMEQETMAQLAARGAAHTLGHAKTGLGHLAGALSSLWRDAAARRTLSAKAQAAIDGKGIERICSAILARLPT